MKKIIACTTFVLCFFAAAQQIQAAYFYFSPDSGAYPPEQSSEINLKLNSEGAQLESATSVLTYDSSKVNISVENGGYFPVMSVDTTVSGRLSISGEQSAGDETGATGDSEFVILTVDPQVESGTFELGFVCSGEDTEDSEIINLTGTNLLASDQDCSQNQAGSYTISSDADADTAASTPTPTPDTTTKGGIEDTSQPVEPDELPETGPEDWLKWITSGLVLIGIGLLIL